MNRVALFVAASGLVACWHEAATPRVAGTVAVLEGRARAIDGDTLEIAGLRVRMKGIAAPERREPGGREATEALAHFIADRPVRCELTSEHTHQRAVGYCFVGAMDLGREMVAGGYVLTCPRFGDRYTGDEPSRPSAGRSPPAYCAAPSGLRPTS